MLAAELRFFFLWIPFAAKAWTGHEFNRRTFWKITASSLCSNVVAATLISKSDDDSSSSCWASEEHSYVEKYQDQDLMEVYFGCGCFWHVQHELVQAERKLLGRSDYQITSRAGYAGGRTILAKDKAICYRKKDLLDSSSSGSSSSADEDFYYGDLGMAEVVSIKIPRSSLYEVAKVYCNLFNKNGYRPDQWNDRGAEYRSLIGIPGGVQKQSKDDDNDDDLVKEILRASLDCGDRIDFAEGKGSDADIRGLVFIMDTNQFPFTIAEKYHQFHDGFNIGENYPQESYNNLAERLSKQGSLEESNCPLQ